MGQLSTDSRVAERLVQDLPATYELYEEGMLLLPAGCLLSQEFQELREEVLQLICQIFR